MRKLLFFSAVAILALPFYVKAQPGPVKVDLGLKVAANFASIKGDEWEKSTKPGFAAGAFFSMNVTRIGGQIEALFSQVKYTGNGITFYQAAKADGNFSSLADSATKGDFVVSYLSIPLLLNVKVAGPLWVQIGPQFNNIVSINDKDKLVKDPDNLFKTSDLSGALGLQVNLANLRLGARYIVGLSDASLSSAASSWKQRNLQLSIGFTFL